MALAAEEVMLLEDNNSLNIRDLDSIIIDSQKDDQILEIVLENEKSNPIIQVVPIGTLPFDISNYVQLDVAPKDFNILESIYRPPNNYKFPRDLSRRKLKFQFNWFTTWPWLAYSPSQNGAYCKYCVLFGPKYAGKGEQKLKRPVNCPYRRWKDAGENFENHQNNLYHKNTQNIISTLRAIGKPLKIIKETHKGTSLIGQPFGSTIQNEIIDVCNDLILRKVVANINKSPFFSVLADESTDISGIEQMSLSARYLYSENDEVQIKEDFLQFIPIQDMRGECLADTIDVYLKKFKINVNFMRGQGYDGAPAMSGHLIGVLSHLIKKYPTAIYVYCSSHSLNLAISDCCSIPVIRSTMGTIGKVYEMFKYPKRSNVLKNILAKEEFGNNHKLVKMCPTRWILRHESVAVFLELVDPIIVALEEICGWTDTSVVAEANGILKAIQDPEFLLAINCINTLFCHTILLCRALQRVNQDMVQALILAEDAYNAILQI
ncbi:52 kDa repressor of the inhibitor of the protein kinase-like [Gordionus sp. m RMFG-2023]|uniref:52 kDa repressor of the inhibitor of the protein kinase-like n=1 Tax=Gordionus sp. m RMFG-2023 TaxID=3053472 RepID=UPI0031FBF99D